MGSDSSKRELQQLRSTYIDYGMKMDELMQVPPPTPLPLPHPRQAGLIQSPPPRLVLVEVLRLPASRAVGAGPRPRAAACLTPGPRPAAGLRRCSAAIGTLPRDN